jgi:predicted extracellular nuclease
MNRYLPKIFSVSLILAIVASSLMVVSPALANNSAQTLPFSQNWSNTGLITTSDDWTGVAGIVGYRGDGLVTSTNIDPQTVLADGSATPVDVNANQTAPNTFTTGGVSEFEITDPVVALQGSGTADAPHIVIYLNTIGQSNISISYNVRDIDGSADNSTQQVALQYRVGNSGNFTNIPAGYISDATTGGAATLVTPINVTLPAAVDNQSDVQIRIITTDASGSDEWVGIDDISITAAGGSTDPSGTGSATPSPVAPGDPTLLAVTVTPGTNPASTGLAVVCDLSSIGGSTTQSFLDDGLNGDASAGDNIFSFAATVDSGTSEGVKNLACSISDAEARAGNTSISLTVQEPVDIVINEILADPDATNGDANGDGIVNTTNDEFVEIVNNEPASLNISGWTLSDGVGVRHTFPANTVIPAGCSIVVFAAGTPTGTFGFSLAQTASSGQLGLNNTGDTVTLNNGVVNVMSYTYGAEGGDNQSLTRDPDVTGADPLVKHSIATGSGGSLFSPGKKVDGSQFAGCPAEKKIHDVQGNGASSPVSGQTVVIQGIVVGDFQDGASGANGDFNGFHVQEEDADVDADPLTSEGIFVFDGNSPAVNVANGDLVQVIGVVSEFNTLTEITSFTGVSVLSSGNALPTAATVSLPVNAVSDFEAYEGMRVTFPQALIISEYFNFDRFGEIVLTSERHLTPTAEFEPGSPGVTQAVQDFLLDKITLDDGRSTQNPNPAIHPNGSPFDLSNLFRGGDTVSNVTGIMDFAFGLYRIQPTQGASYNSVNPRPAAPEDVGGRVKVASLNTLNFFITPDYPTGNPLDNKCGPLQNVECRGADFDQPTEFTRQRDKLLATLVGLNADVVGLNELENTTGVSPLGDPTNGIVAGLNAAFGPGTYSFIDTGVIGTDAIRVGFIYKATTVVPVGDFAILDSSVDPRFNDAKNRPALAQTFEELATGARFTVVVNHFKSKGSDCNDVGDPDISDGQGNCNQTRKAAAQALVDWLATDPTNSGDADFLIIGDLNSYDKEDPIDAIKAGADDTAGTSDDYADLAFQFHGEDAYSYVFDGQTGYLDYGLANGSLFRQVTGMTDWHINADEADLIDYDTSFKLTAQDAIYAPDAYRSSDHDPVLIGLELDPPFPSTAVLDNFNRPASALGPNWRGAISAYKIINNSQVDVRNSGPIYWKNAFGADQEVFVTLTNVDEDGLEQNLLLKVQGSVVPNWGAGAIEALYDANTNTVTVWTFRPDTLAWYGYSPISVTFNDGDQFGARALSNGLVLIYKNGVEVGSVTLNAGDQAFFNPRGGRIGLWFINANDAIFDDFGGGDAILP